MAFTCDSCRKKHTTRPQITMTGRQLCERCNDSLLGATAGYVASGTIEGAISTSGWYSRLRERRRKTP